MKMIEHLCLLRWLLVQIGSVLFISERLSLKIHMYSIVQFRVYLFRDRVVDWSQRETFNRHKFF